MTSRTGPAGGLSAEWQHLSGKNRRVLDSVFLRVHCAGNKVSPRGAARRWQFDPNSRQTTCLSADESAVRTSDVWFAPDMELGHWVTYCRSMGHLGHLSLPGQTGHHFDPVWNPEFFRFSKKMPKMQNVHLKWWNDKSHCQVSVVGLKSLDVSPCNELLLLPMIIKNSLAWENFFTHKSTFGVHYRTGSLGQLGLRVAGFPGHWVAGSQNVTQFHLWFARLAGGG